MNINNIVIYFLKYYCLLLTEGIYTDMLFQGHFPEIKGMVYDH